MRLDEKVLIEGGNLVFNLLVIVRKFIQTNVSEQLIASVLLPIINDC